MASLGSAESLYLETDVGRAEWEQGRMPGLPSWFLLRVSVRMLSKRNEGDCVCAEKPRGNFGTWTFWTCSESHPVLLQK